MAGAEPSMGEEASAIFWVRRTLLAAAIAGCVLAAYFAPDFPPKNYAATFDEGHYLSLMRFGWASVSTGDTSNYYAAKSLPFLLARALFAFSPAGWDLPAYFRGMVVFNLLCLGLIGWIVSRILKLQRLEHLTGIAWILLLVNRSFLSFYIYYPRLPDIFVMAVGTLFLLGFLAKDRKTVWLSYCAALFSSPHLSLFILSAIVFSGAGRDSRPCERTANHLFWYAVLALPALAGAYWAFRIAPEKSRDVAASWGNVRYFDDPRIFMLSLLAAAAMFWLALEPMRRWSPRDIFASIDWKGMAAGLILLAASVAWVGSRAIKSEVGDRSIRAIPIVLTYTVSKPFQGLMTYFVCYGVLGALLVLNWKRLSAWIAEQGPGFALGFSFIALYFGLSGEVRHAIFLMPAVLVGLCDTGRDSLSRINPAKLIWLNLMVALNAHLFILADPRYSGEPHLSAFGMCWSPIHYGVAVGLTAIMALVVAKWIPLREKRGA